MAHRCEVCESFRPQSDLDEPRELLELSFDGRRVLLCRGHAGIAKNSAVSTLEQLRALYGESGGNRSYISRRSRGADSTSHAPRSAGRRANDLRA
jgi:hypothetical protein